MTTTLTRHRRFTWPKNQKSRPPHLSLGVRRELKSLQGESDGSVRPIDEPRGRRVSLAVHQTSAEGRYRDTDICMWPDEWHLNKNEKITRTPKVVDDGVFKRVLRTVGRWRVTAADVQFSSRREMWSRGLEIYILSQLVNWGLDCGAPGVWEWKKKKVYLFLNNLKE